MQYFSNILVGVDLQSGDRLATESLPEPTKIAVDRAIWVASQSNAKLTFHAVLELSGAGFEEMQLEDGEGAKTVKDTALAVLDELVAKAAAEGVEATRELSFGRPWEEVVKQVQRGGHDLVICGTRNRSAASRLLFGSTTGKLLRFCPCPVWVTKPDPIPDESVILVASDFSDVSNTALRIGVDAAQASNSRLLVMHSVERVRDPGAWATGTPTQGGFHADLAEKKADAEKRLQQQLEGTDYRTLPHGVQLLVETGPSDIALLDAIEDHHVDLLIMGTIARTGISGWLVGNTCEKLLPQVPCSVVTVKPDGYESPIHAD